MEDNKFIKEWKEITLDDIYEIKQGKHLSLNELLDEGYVVYGANGKVGYYNNYMYEKPTLLVTCRGATCGSINLTEPKSWVTGNSMALIPKEEVNINFMKYLLAYISFKDVISGSAQPQIIATTLKKKKLTIPTLNIQKKVADILEKAESALEKRKEAIKLLDKLVKSRFIEIFGDFESNTYKYPRLNIGRICEKITDGTHKTPRYISDGIKFISAKDIKTGKIDLTDTKFISLEEYKEIQKRCQLEKGDILLSKSGSIGTPVILDTCEPLGIFESLAVIKLKKNIVNNIYMCEFLKSDWAQKRMVFGTKGISIKHLHLNVIRELDVFLPPLELQNEFATFVNHLDKLKFEMQKSVEEMENNFNSLMQRAFKGELFN